MTAREIGSLLLGLSMAGCLGEASPLAGTASGEDATLIEILEADARGDCPRVLRLADHFETRHPPRLDQVAFVVGRCLYRDDRLAEAATVLDRIAHSPRRAYTRDALYLGARARYRLGDLEAALGRFDALLACCPGLRLDNATFYRARTLYRLDRLAEARAGFTALLEQPDATALYRSRSLYYTGKALYKGALGGPDEAREAGLTGAIEWYDRVLADFPDSSVADDAAHARGKALFRGRAFEAAREAFAAVVEDYPGGSAGARAAYYLGRTHSELRAYDTAIAHLERFERAHPASAFVDNARYHRGRAHYRAGVANADPREFAAAGTVLDSLLSDFPRSFYADAARYFGARAAYRRDLRLDALPRFERVANTPTTSYADDGRYYAGMCEYHLGVDTADSPRWEAAVAHFEGLGREHPTSRRLAASAYFGGRALTRLERLGLADAQFGRVIDEFPTSTYLDNAFRRRVEVRAAQGDCRGAFEALEAMRRRTPDSPLTARAEAASEAAGC